MQNITKQTQIFKILAFTALLAAMVPFSMVSAISRTDAENAVRAAYQQCLGRNPESSGLKHHTDLIVNGKSASQVKKDICNSEEAKNYSSNSANAAQSPSSFQRPNTQPSVVKKSSVDKRQDAIAAVRDSYRTCLGREPEQSGLDHHVNIILNGKSASEVKQDICKSEEALNYKNRNSVSSSNSNTSNNINKPFNVPSCNLSGDHVVNLGGDVFYATAGQNHSRTVSVNIPKGNYKLTVQTWDDHSGHGGQNQNKEIVNINLYNNSTLLKGGLRSNDVPENSDWQNTNLGNINFSNSINKIVVEHAYYQNSNSPESVVPLCLSFNKINKYTPPTNPNPTNLNIECRVSDTNIEEGEDVRFSVDIDGGNSPYDIEWYNDAEDIDDFDLDDNDQIVQIDDEGRYYVSVRVTDDDGRSRTDACPVIVVEEEDDDDDLRVQCEISDTTISEGDRVTIEVDIEGGDGPYDIEWSGDADEIDDFDDNDDRQTVRIDDSGTYRLRVTVEDDDGNEDSDTCTIRVSDDDNDVNVLSTTDGQLAGLSSIYLNQVPYTGPEDTLKVLGFISLVLIWSGTISYYLLKDRKKKQFSNRIQAFKEVNKANLA